MANRTATVVVVMLLWAPVISQQRQDPPSPSKYAMRPDLSNMTETAHGERVRGLRAHELDSAIFLSFSQTPRPAAVRGFTGILSRRLMSSGTVV